MKGIKLPIMVHTESTFTFEELGIEVADDECTSKYFIFYTIDVIASRMKNEDKHTMIQSGGRDFICLLPIKEVTLLIENNA